jgi:uncharacterized protein (TIGR02646 family)
VRHVPKGAEPPPLTEYRAQPGARCDGDSGFPPVKDAVRVALEREQRGLCCYCEQHVQATERGMRVAHCVPQSVDETRTLDWRNLLGASRGGEGSREVHCDVAKGDQEIQIDPTQEAHVATTSFGADGRLRSSREAFQRDIDATPRLNGESLVDRRQRALDDYIRPRTSGYGGPISRETIERWLTELGGAPEGRALPPFVSFLRWWLERKARRSQR